MHRYALAILLVVVATPATAATLNFPKDYPKIVDAVAAAEDGDKIVVSAGTYGEFVGSFSISRGK